MERSNMEEAVRFNVRNSRQANAQRVRYGHGVDFSTAAFGQRRKTLRNSLQTLISEAELTSIGIDPTQRAEKISLSQFVTIANAVSAKNPDVSE